MKAKTRVRVTDSVYKVDIDNRVVICTLQCNVQPEKVTDIPWPLLIEETRLPDWMYHYGLTEDGTFVVTGKARCAKSDTFNTKTGRMIAEARAKKKMYHVAYKFWCWMYDRLEKKMQETTKIMNGNFEALRKEKEHIQILEYSL